MEEDDDDDDELFLCLSEIQQLFSVSCSKTFPIQRFPLTTREKCLNPSITIYKIMILYIWYFTFMRELVIYKILCFIFSCMKGTVFCWNCLRWFCSQTILVTVRSKVCFCGRSLGGIAGSNPAEGMIPISYGWCVLSGRDLSDGPIPLPEESHRVWTGATITSTPTVSKQKEVETKKERKIVVTLCPFRE